MTTDTIPTDETADADAVEEGVVVDEAPTQSRDVAVRPAAAGEVAVLPTARPAVARAYTDPQGVIHIPTPVAGIELKFTSTQVTLDAAQLTLLAPLGMKADYDPKQVAIFLMTSLERGLDPWRKEVYLFQYKDSTAPGGNRYVSHTGIGGFQGLAEDTGEYVGQVGPQWCGPDGQWMDFWPHRDRAPVAARVGILRKGFDGPVWGVAMYDEYAATKDVWKGPQGERYKAGVEVTAQWKPAALGGKPAVMTAKCAEAAGFRKAFPRKLSGLYVTEEFDKLREAERAAQEEAARERRLAAMEQAQAAVVRPTSPGPAARAAGSRPQAQPTPPPTAAAAAAESAVPVSSPVASAPAGDDVLGMLRAEFAEQATICGIAQAALGRRWVAQFRRNVEDFDEAQMRTLVHALREMVGGLLRSAGRTAEADAYANAPDHAPLDVLFGRK
ncbi:recombinase RecT [Micromonospora lupini]|uniref:recombinase RecT n=1 Tax=Micromonospora lupini TaxID=285679 RepID=UPI002259BD9A|nr:recombinase RecT [Micromonospora lupini]MCX5070839.1 recombinase RecT [Micromonospora lupini]